MQITNTPATKQLLQIHRPRSTHWVGDGFPVRSIFDYENLGREALSPFLLMDYAGPAEFAPAVEPRGVGEHPHRGFETVTLAYQGEVEHRDSNGGGGRIGPGDVQWMTAASGVMHEEKHSRAFTESGGVFEMIQLWVNLPAKDKMSTPGYQTLPAGRIPAVKLPDRAGEVRVVAGEYEGARGPAHTFTPINLWEISLRAGARATFDLPEGHTAAFFVRRGRIELPGGGETAGVASLVQFSREGRRVTLAAREDTALLFLGGEPIAEPVVGQGPFVMNTAGEIRQAIADVRAGRFGRLEPAALS
jgi:redox-sensitive bicupin YhaK (pirin superfamily)